MNKTLVNITANLTSLQEALELTEMVNIARDLPVRHYQMNGMYCREMLMPKNSMVIGKTHKKEHLCLVTKGKVQVLSDEAVLEIEAPFIYKSQAGAKRALKALSDVVWVTVHRTDLLTIDEIEAELVHDF